MGLTLLIGMQQNIIHLYSCVCNSACKYKHDFVALERVWKPIVVQYAIYMSETPLRMDNSVRQETSRVQ